MAEDVGRVVIVGASLAGAKAAETLRDEGYDGSVVLIGEESERPYERPSLSKDFLRDPDAVPTYVHDETFYADHEIELRLSTHVDELDPARGTVVLDSGEVVAFDRAVLATGATPRHLPLPGFDDARVRYLRTADDARFLRRSIGPDDHVVVVGAGWIGCEVAASARQLGATVSVLEGASVPFERILGPEVGGFYRDLHLRHGVDLRLGIHIEGLRSGSDELAVELSGGEVVAGSLVLVGIGAAPRTELAEHAALALDNGVAVDEYLQSSAPNVFAAGDIASAWHPRFGRRIRLEHWSAALEQGPVVARNVLGMKVPYERVPYFFSDQYETGMEYAGFAPEWDQVVFRGDPDDGEFIAFWLREGRLAAGMNLNVWDVSETIAAIVSAGRPVDVAALVDPSFDLASLVSEPQ